MAKEYKLSAERLEALKEELTYLKTVREKEVADQIKEARSFGDLSENSEYDEAKNEQGKLYSRIAEIEEILSNYVVIEESEEDHSEECEMVSEHEMLRKMKRKPKSKEKCYRDRMYSRHQVERRSGRRDKKDNLQTAKTAADNKKTKL